MLDFGVARLVAAGEIDTAAPPRTMPPSDIHSDETLGGHEMRVTSSGTLLGTPLYMAPEVWRGEAATRASDLYSFGVLAYEVLTGSLPHTMKSRARREPPRRPSRVRAEVPSSMDAPLLAMLADDPARRPAAAREAVAAVRSAWRTVGRDRWTAREHPRRQVAAATVAVLVVILTAAVGGHDLVRTLEDRTVDWRFAARPRRPPDERLLLLSLDEASLALDPAPLASRADEVSRTLERIFEAGAKGIAVDLLLPSSWSTSSAFSELVLRRRERLTLAAFAAPGGTTVGPECLARTTTLALGERWFDIFGFANLDEGPDGRIRQARLEYRDRDGHRRDAFATRAARTFGLPAPAATTERFWIDATIDLTRLPRLSWKDVEPALETEPSPFQGRLVILGAELAGSGDEHRLPSDVAPSGVSGMVLQAMIVDTLVSGRRIASAPMPIVWAAVVIAAAAVVGVSLVRPRPYDGPRLAAGLLAVWAGIVALAWYALDGLVPVVAPVGALLLASTMGVLLRFLLPVPSFAADGETDVANRRPRRAR